MYDETRKLAICKLVAELLFIKFNSVDGLMVFTRRTNKWAKVNVYLICISTVLPNNVHMVIFLLFDFPSN